MPSKNPEIRKAVNRAYYHRNIIAIKAREAVRRQRNRRKLALAARLYRKTNRLKCNAASRTKNKRYRQINTQFRIRDCLRVSLKRALKRQHQPKTAKVLSLLGCSIPDFRIYLESKFEPDMSWSNYGPKGWHIDHIIPCALFDLSKPEHQKRCFHFSNLQPLWAAQNLQKGPRLTTPQFNLL